MCKFEYQNHITVPRTARTMMDDVLTNKRKHFSLLAWVNSFNIDEKIEEISQLSNGMVFCRCLRLFGFRPDDSVNQSPIEFVISKLSDFYSCDLTKHGVLELSKISAGEEEEIAKVLVLLLCVAVKHSENEKFIEAILSLPDDVQFDLKYFIESTLDQIDSGKITSGGLTLGCEVNLAVHNTPTCSSLSTSKCYSIASPVLQSWLCSPYVTDEPTPKISSNQLFECVEVKQLKHQLRMMEKELEMQRSLVTDYEDEVALLSEERSNLIVSVAEKNEKLRQLSEKYEEVENLEDVESKLQRAEEEIKSLKQQLEIAREEQNCKTELQQKTRDQQEELAELYKAKNLLQVKLLKYQHQAQELELECKSQQSQAARSLKRCNEALQKIDTLEKQNVDLQDDLTKQRASLAVYSDQNATLQQKNSTLSHELALLQEQYTTTMCVVGSQGQENEQLQHALHKMEEKHNGELDVKEEQLKILQEQVMLLTTRIEKLLVDNEQQAKEFDEKEATLRAEWQEKISAHEANSSLQLSKAKEMVKSCQLTISNLTRERDEERISAAESLENLETTYKLKFNSLEQQITECKETTEQKVVQLKQQDLQLKETMEDLQQKDEQLEQCHKMITLLEQKLTSMTVEFAKAEDYKQRHEDDIDKLNGEHKLTVLELSRQLDEANSKQKKLVDANEKLREMVAEKEAEYGSLQREFIEQRNDHQKILQQCDELNDERQVLLSRVNQNQADAKQQIEVMAEELKQLHSEKLESTAEYEAYQIVMKQKEISLLHDIKELQQEKELALQKEEQLTVQLKQYQEEVTELEQKLSSTIAGAEEQHSIYLDKLNDGHKLKVMQLSQQLEMVTKEYEMYRTKINQQLAEQNEKFSEEVANKEVEHASLLNMFNKREEDYFNVLQQVEKLAKDNDKLLVDLKQSQLIGKHQAKQFNHQQDIMSKELEQLHNEKMKITAEYQSIQRVVQEKEDNLLHEIAELRQKQGVAQQELEDSLGKITLIKDEQSKFLVQIDNLNNTLQCMRNGHMVEVESYQATIDKELSAKNELEMKNKLLSQELNSVKHELSIVARDTKGIWEQQLEENLSKVHEQLSVKELSLQQVSQDLFISKQEYDKTVGLLEEKKNELIRLEAGYQTEKNHTATLLEKIAQLQAQMTSDKQQSMVELEAVRNENEKLLKSVDDLSSQQVATNNQLEQDCQKKFVALEQSNNEKFEEITRMKVEMISLQNELRVLQLNHQDLMDCLTIEREKNSLLEKETKQLKATIKEFEKENVRVHKLMVQQKYSVRSYDDEQTHLQRLHSEMDQQSSGHVIPLQATEEDDKSSRLEELRTRNSFRPPHLKSCYPTELQLDCGTPRSSEYQLKVAPGYLEISPPHKRNMAQRQQLDSPDSVKRRLSAPPTPTTATQQLAACRRMNLRSYLTDENMPPLSRPSDAFEISLNLDEQSRVKMEERKSKMLQRMSGTRKTQQRSTATVIKPLRARNASKKK